MQSSIDKLQDKREYILKLENIESQLEELFNYNELNDIRSVPADRQFSDHLEYFLENLEHEIGYQERKLNDLEGNIIYNDVKTC